MLPSVLRRTLRRGNYRENFGQRLGIYTESERLRFAQERWTWIHSISVGETLIALKLARELHRNDPSLRVVISVTTSTGFALAREASAPWLEVIYNPIDLPSVVRAAIETIRPRQLLFVEGEAWPNLLAQCRLRGIPTALVAARLSPRSESRFRRFRNWTGPIFSMLDTICVPELEDIARWESLGVQGVGLRHTGSIKFDLAATSAPSRVSEFRAWLKPLGVTEGRPIIVAGSTWAPEEAVLGALLGDLRREFPEVFLIIVPRHVERSAEILHALRSSGLKVRVRSDLPLSAPDACDVLLVDTTGELREWYALATLVFVGKSLPGIADVGGQNPAEPAALGKPVVFGPHMENFAPVVKLLLGRDSCLQVAGAEDLLTAVGGLLREPGRRRSLSLNALDALEVHQGATARTAQLFGIGAD